MTRILPSLFYLGVPVVWVLMSRQLARGGWSKLSRKYTARMSPHGTRFGWLSGHVGKTDFSSTLTIWIAEEGLYLRPGLLFRLFHPALLIPWDKIAQVNEDHTAVRTITSVSARIEGVGIGFWRTGAYGSVFGAHVGDRITVEQPKLPKKKRRLPRGSITPGPMGWFLLGIFAAIFGVSIWVPKHPEHQQVAGAFGWFCFGLCFVVMGFSTIRDGEYWSYNRRVARADHPVRFWCNVSGAFLSALCFWAAGVAWWIQSSPHR